MDSNILKLLSKIPKGANPVLDAIGIIPTAQDVFNPKDNIITALQNFGTSVENQFAAPGQERRYVGSNPAAVAANRRLDARNVGDITGRYIPGSQQYPSLSQGTRRGKAVRNQYNQYSGVIGSIPPSADGKSYRRAELELADAARAGGGGGGGGNAGYSVSNFVGDSGTPADRAHKQEASRVAQLTEQDPLFKKYKIGELTKAYNEAKGDEREKIGLQIWATTNPDLARKLKPGQLGYEEATSAFQSISPLGRFQAQTGDMQYANNMTQPIAEFGTINPYNQQALNMPLTGIQVPPTNQIGTKEVFAASSPIPGATQAFTDPLQFLTTEDTSEIQKALIKKKFDELIK